LNKKGPQSGPRGRSADQRITDMQDLHAVGTTDGVVAVTFGQDDPVALLHQPTLEQFVDRRLAHLVGRCGESETLVVGVCSVSSGLTSELVLGMP